MKKTTFIALALLGFACALTVWRVGLFSDAVITHGTVSRFEASRVSPDTSSDAAVTYRMFVKFMDHNDEIQEYEAGFSSSVQPYHTGEKILIQYNRYDSSSASPVYMHPFNSWGIIWAAIVAAIVFALTPFFSKKPHRILDRKMKHARALYDKQNRKKRSPSIPD